MDIEIEQSLLEGWVLSTRSDGYFQIQKDDENDVFDSDFDAYIHVLERADEGSEYHKDAIYKHGREAWKFGE